MPLERLSVTLAVFLLLCGLSSAYSQDVNRYILLHKNRKNESIVKPSPLASGYDQTTAVEFRYRHDASDAMKRRVERVIPPVEELEEDEFSAANSDIFGNNSLFMEESSTLLQELEEETVEAINNQKQQEQNKLAAQRKQNIASYAASVEAKIKREKEAALAALLAPKKEEPVWSEDYGPTEEVEEEIDENSVILTTDSSGKISVKKPTAKTTASGTTDVASNTVSIASDTASLASSTKAIGSLKNKNN